MKVVKKIRKVVISIVLTIISFSNKIFALSPIISPQLAYGPPPQENLKPITTLIWIIARTFIIPIALIVGLIIYFKKSKNSKKKKILITIGIIAITAIWYFVGNKIIYEIN